MSEELKPCPFCGGEAEIERKGTMRASMIIACSDCGCRLESGDVSGLTSSTNLSWNERVTRQGWLPIETAPKDEVVICYDDFYGGLYFCRWDGSTRYGDGTPRLHPIDDSTNDFQFTHWMPLPPTPKD